MNKNYIFVLGIVVVVIVIIGVVVLYQLPSMTLDQIIKNRDCAALEKWENEHMFDDDLNVSSEQLTAAMKLATECVGKILNNMLGSSTSLSDYMGPSEILNEIVETNDCDGWMTLSKEYDEIFLAAISNYTTTDFNTFDIYCEKRINSNK